MDASLVDQQKPTVSGIRGETLSAQQLYQHDPLFLLFKNRWQLSDPLIILGVMVFPCAVFLIGWFSWIDKVRFWTTGDTLSAILTIGLFPLLWLIYLRVPASVASLFTTLKEHDIIGEPREDLPAAKLQTYEGFLQHLVNWMDKGWWMVVSLLIPVVYTTIRLVLIDPRILHPVPYWFAICILIIYLPVMYVASITIVRLLLAVIFVNQLFLLFTIKLKPLHPDGSGGLGTLGRLLWLSVTIMLWDALLICITLLSSNLSWFSPLEMILFASVYVALTPSLFIGWLVFPHRVMLEARDKVLQPLAEEFQQAILQSLSAEKDNTQLVIADSQHLTALKQRYDLVRDSFPTWPVEISGVSRLTITVFLPLLFPLLLPLLASFIVFASHALGLQ